MRLPERGGHDSGLAPFGASTVGHPAGLLCEAVLGAVRGAVGLLCRTVPRVVWLAVGLLCRAVELVVGLVGWDEGPLGCAVLLKSKLW